jgi:glycosyltransferase involved in cell wall biosynthesis
MVDFTVAICTYNGEKRLPDVLEKLRSQAETDSLSWEILIIDNNSNDGTADLVKNYISNWSESCPLKYYFEAEQGLAFARRCAVREAKSELIGFLDDDNLPYPNWVVEAYKFGQKHPQAGAYGGQIHGKFEVEPPEGFQRISGLLALIEGKKTYCFNHKFAKTAKKVFPPGAGIVVRKKAWLESVSELPQLNQIGEDIEFLYSMFSKDWELWFNAEMEIDHVMPQSRLSKEYLTKFLFKNGLYRYRIRMLNYQPWQRPLVIFPYAINDLKKLILHWLKYNRNLQNDTIALAEMNLLLGSLLSPFSYWRNYLLKV